MKKIIVIAAHPDDEILGMGGTVAKFTAEGKEVHLLIVTDGSSSQYRNADNLKEILEEKKKETRKAAATVGISDITYGGLPDMQLDVTPHITVNQVIESAIERIRPDTVFTHFWGDVNKDHRCVFESTMVAVRPTKGQCVREVYCYRVPSSTEWNVNAADTAFMPNTYVDIEKYKEQKYEAMAAYATELRDYPHPRSLAYLRKMDESTGMQIGTGAAEAFVLVRKIED